MLTESEIQKYRDEGYLVFERLIAGDRLRRYQSLFDELVARSKARKPGGGWTYELDGYGEVRPDGLLHKIQGVCLVEPRVLDLAREGPIVSRVASLLGPKFDVLGTKFFPLLPQGGTSTKWHQDNFYLGTDSEDIVTCGVYLQDADIENGCLKIIPRSHREGAFQHIRDPGTYGSWVEVDEAQAVPLEVPAGTVILFSGNLLHGANANISTRSRYSTAWHYLPESLELGPFRRGLYEDRHPVEA